MAGAAALAIGVVGAVRGWGVAECQTAGLITGAALLMLGLLGEIARSGIPATPLGAGGQAAPIAVLHTRQRLIEATESPAPPESPRSIGLGTVRMALLIAGAVLWAGTILWVAL
jgi:hypothetical protein